MVYSPYSLARSAEVWAKKEKSHIPSYIITMIEDAYKKRDELTSVMQEALKKELEMIRKKEISANYNTSTLSNSVDDRKISPRMITIPTYTVLLLRAFDPLKKTCVDLSGNTLELDAGKQNIEERISKSSILLDHTVNVPSSKELENEKYGKIFEPYLYEAKSGNFQIALVDDNGNIKDTQNRELEFAYSHGFGYYRKQLLMDC